MRRAQKTVPVNTLETWVPGTAELCCRFHTAGSVNRLGAVAFRPAEEHGSESP